MTIYQILTLLFGSGLLASVGGYFLKRIRDNDRKTEAVQRGVQALLRDRLIAEYNKYSDMGYAPIYARENFENMWTQYHNLGKNGVMDGIHNKFMKLPTEKERRS
jgi:hypothetical protein